MMYQLYKWVKTMVKMQNIWAALNQKKGFSNLYQQQIPGLASTHIMIVKNLNKLCILNA